MFMERAADFHIWKVIFTCNLRKYHGDKKTPHMVQK
jgi:hypothetical protein